MYKFDSPHILHIDFCYNLNFADLKYFFKIIFFAFFIKNFSFFFKLFFIYFIYFLFFCFCNFLHYCPTFIHIHIHIFSSPCKFLFHTICFTPPCWFKSLKCGATFGSYTHTHIYTDKHKRRSFFGFQWFPPSTRIAAQFIIYLFHYFYIYFWRFLYWGKILKRVCASRLCHVMGIAVSKCWWS